MKKLIRYSIVVLAIASLALEGCRSIGLFQRNGLCPAYSSVPPRRR